MVTYRNGVECACGNVFVSGPFQCGTKHIPQCNNICNKVLECGHLCAAKCHHGDCPKCTRICSKPCTSHNIMVHNMPCHVDNRSCGRTCNKLLKICGIHKCQRTCHSGKCLKDSDAAKRSKKGCGQICGLPLKCGHQCMAKCHPGTPCKTEACKAQIIVQCKCGNSSLREYCRGRTEYELKAIPCSEDCQVAERNKRFRDALNLNNSKSEQKEANNQKTMIPFAASVLKRILKWMKSDKNKILISKEKKQIVAPKFVYYIEGILSAYICDQSEDFKAFKSQYKDISVCGQCISLKPMSSEQRFIVYSMVTHYHIKAEKIETGKSEHSYIELSKTKHSAITDYLLSAALIEYQLRGDEIETLENMPPSLIMVVDNAENVSSSIVQNRLLAWTGDYRMYRRNEQLFIVFSNEKLRNSAMTQMKKFDARKATKSDSLNAANIVQKKKTERRKKAKAAKAKNAKGVSDSYGDVSEANKEWTTIGSPHAISSGKMKKKEAK